jgi:hypothetical protein
MTHQIWDDETGNIIASLGSELEARVFLRSMLDANGPEGVRDLAVVAYPDDDADPFTVLEGADFIASYQVSA